MIYVSNWWLDFGQGGLRQAAMYNNRWLDHWISSSNPPGWCGYCLQHVIHYNFGDVFRKLRNLTAISSHVAERNKITGGIKYLKIVKKFTRFCLELLSWIYFLLTGRRIKMLVICHGKRISKIQRIYLTPFNSDSTEYNLHWRILCSFQIREEVKQTLSNFTRERKTKSWAASYSVACRY